MKLVLYSVHLAVVCLVATQLPRVSWSSTSSSSCSRSPSCSCCATKLLSCASICSQLSSCVSLIDIICTRCRMVFSRSLPAKYFLTHQIFLRVDLFPDGVAPVSLGPEPGELPGPEHGEDGQHQDHHQELPGQGAGHLCKYVDMSRS